MDKILEVIVVEGSHDSQKLKSFYDVETIETSGTHLSIKTMELIEQVQKTRGIIIFTDPDAPGEKIRAQINQKIKGCKNAFVFKEDAKTSKKVGIEHASKAVLDKALKQLVTYKEDVNYTLSLQDFNALGLNGEKDSTIKRMKIATVYNIGKCNAKTLYKRLNMLEVKLEALAKILADE